jgi:hypothetical protein
MNLLVSVIVDAFRAQAEVAIEASRAMFVYLE